MNYLALLILPLLIASTGCTTSRAAPAVQKISRTPLLTAQLAETKNVQRIEVVRVELPPGIHAPLHLHPCPVVGQVLSGSIVFQIEGEAERVLKPGDAFYEPANVRVAKFDAGPEPSSFVAYYLCGEGDRELIRLLK